MVDKDPVDNNPNPQEVFWDIAKSIQKRAAGERKVTPIKIEVSKEPWLLAGITFKPLIPLSNIDCPELIRFLEPNSSTNGSNPQYLKFFSCSNIPPESGSPTGHFLLNFSLTDTPKTDFSEPGNPITLRIEKGSTQSGHSTDINMVLAEVKDLVDTVIENNGCKATFASIEQNLES